jgi:hypothetical protein
MKALVLYTLFVAMGGVAAALVGLYVEREFSEAAGLVAFLGFFFANFVTSWIAVILVIDGSLRNGLGRAEQTTLERQARTA